MLQWCDCGAVTTSYSVTAAEKLGRQKSVATTISSAWASPPSLCIGTLKALTPTLGKKMLAYHLHPPHIWAGRVLLELDWDRSLVISADTELQVAAGRRGNTMAVWIVYMEHKNLSNKGPTILSVWAVILLCTVFLSIFFHQMYLHISIVAHNLVIICTHHYQHESS